MKVEVPFFKQTTSLNCGPTALRMVLAYFGRDEGIKELEKRTGINEGKALSTIQLATAAASLGHKADFYSKNIFFNEENLKHDYYKNYSDMDLKQSENLVKDAKSEGVKVKERILSIGEILKFVNEDSIPIALLDWNIVKFRKEKGYLGHFVPIVGHDNKNVYVHDPDPEKGTGEFIKISREVFDQSRKSSGTDEDIVIIYRDNFS